MRQQKPAAKAPERNQPVPGEKRVDNTRLLPYVFQDSSSGMNVARFLLPVEWQVSGEVTWNMNAPSNPSNIHLLLYNPDNLEAVEVLPSFFFGYTNDPQSLMGFQMSGSIYGNEIHPPMPIINVIREILIPRLRNIPGLQILAEENLPDLDQRRGYKPEIAQGSQYYSEGGRIRLAYFHHDRQVEEDFFASVRLTRIQVGMSFFGAGPMFLDYWYTGFVHAFRATPEELNTKRAVYEAIACSFEIDPQFRAYVSKVIRQLTQGFINRTNQMGAAARQVGKTLSETSDLINESYWKRTAEHNAHAAARNQTQGVSQSGDAFSHYIRGTDDYFDPMSGKTVELDASHRHIWSDGSGNYIFSDDAGYNPNVGDTTNWVEMKPGSE